MTWRNARVIGLMRLLRLLRFVLKGRMCCANGGGALVMAAKATRTRTNVVYFLQTRDAHWARKLDMEKDAKLFDILDQRIRRGPRTLGGHAFRGVATIARLVLM
jgi:hypothetical protein